jgi:hypothetical protein
VSLSCCRNGANFPSFVTFVPFRGWQSFWLSRF